VPFFNVAASEFVELFVGRGAARVRELFKEAREAAPSVGPDRECLPRHHSHCRPSFLN
jgi:hypothetical protein